LIIEAEEHQHHTRGRGKEKDYEKSGRVSKWKRVKEEFL